MNELTKVQKRLVPKFIFPARIREADDICDIMTKGFSVRHSD